MSNKILSYILLIAIIGDLLIPYILASFYKSYRHTTMVMTSLGNPSSPVRRVYNVWLILLGVLLICSTPLIYVKYSIISKNFSIVTMAFIILFGIGAGIMAGIFSVNENKEVITIASKIHGVGSAMGFTLLLFVPLFLAMLSFIGANIVDGILFIFCFVLALFFFVLFVMGDNPKFQDTIIKNEGIWQRLTLLFMYVPLAYIAMAELL